MAFSDPTKNIDQFALGPGMEVADFGAGAGYYAVAAAEAVGEHGAVYVIDIQRELLTKVTNLATPAQKKVLNYICANLEEKNGSTLREGALDAVIMSNLMFQVGDKQAVLTEAYRVLKEGGRALVIDWSESFGGLGPEEGHIVSKDTVLELAADVGLALQEEIDAGEYHYGLILKK